MSRSRRAGRRDRPTPRRYEPRAATPPSTRVGSRPRSGSWSKGSGRGGAAGPVSTPLLVAALIGGLALAGIAFVAATSFGGASPTPGAQAGSCPTSQPPALADGETRTVTVETAKGSIVVAVDGSRSPIAAGNFVALAGCGYYDGVVFHRVATLVDGTPFVIQGGDPTGTGGGGPGYTIADEPVTTPYRRGTVAMARTSAPNSQGSQFFIVLDDRAGVILAAANTYAIFGEVTAGMDVADAIYAAAGGVELPADPVRMTRLTVSSP